MSDDQRTKTMRGLVLWVLVVAVTLGASALWAGTEGRITGVVVDPDGKPIQDVRVTVAAVGLDIQRSAETSKKGKFTITVLNASHDFTIKLEKEGFQTAQEPIDPIVGGTLKLSYTLTPGQTIAPEMLAELERKGQGAKLYNEGVQKFSAGDITGAAELFQQSLAEDPELGLAHLALARIYLARNDPASALPHAEKTRELVPEDELAELLLFDSLWDLEQYERALPLLDEMVESGKAADKVAVRAYNAGAHAVRQNDTTVAKQRFEQALGLLPELLPAHLTLGQLKLNEAFQSDPPNAESLQASLAHATTYADANPDDAKAQKLLYQVYTAMGEEDAAMQAFDRMAAAGPEMVAQAFFEDGVEDFNAGRNDAALAAFEKVLRAKSDHADAHYFLGLANASAGNIPKAKEHFARFLELAPDHPEAGTARDMLEGL